MAGFMNNSLSSWHQAARALLRHPFQSFLSTLGIILGMAVLIAMLAGMAGAKRETLEQIRNLGANAFIIQPKPLTESQKMTQSNLRSSGLTLPDVEALRRQLPSGSVLATLLLSNQTISNTVGGDPVPVYGVNAAYVAARGFSMQRGRGITARDMLKKNHVAILGNVAATSLSSMDGKIRIEDALYRVVGKLQKMSGPQSKQVSLLSLQPIDIAVLVPISTVIDQIGRADVSEVIVRIPDRYPLERTAALAERFLLSRHKNLRDFNVVEPLALIEQSNRLQLLFNILAGLTAISMLLLGGLGVASTMLANLAERMREIGIRRAIGASRKHIIWQFLLEAFMLTNVGGIVGVFLGFLLALAISQLTGWRSEIEPWSIALAFMVITLVGLMSGLTPALRAGRIPPIMALRQ